MARPAAAGILRAFRGVAEAGITHIEDIMVMGLTRRRFGGVAGALAAGLLFAASAVAQDTGKAPSGEPITIGFSMALTGSLAVNGKSGLLATQIWAEDVNAKGGLLGRPVKLIYYDDQTNPSQVPGIYTKLLDVDKVDFVVSGYGTNISAPAMPVIIGHKKTFVSLFALDIN
ncbi:MAG: ABC transporter substrate-binding protein, partial [Alphaproteobacteria bacterium]